LKISIALATFNGASYLQEQLESFLGQLRRPDQVVICDDKSSDNTKEILDEFVQIAPFNVRVVYNSANLGLAKNFEKAISLCDGDLIFLSDQDDVWDKEKIRKVEAISLKNPHSHVFVSDAIYTDENLNPTGITVLQRVLSYSGREKDHIHGAATAITKNFRDYVLPFPRACCPAHDVYIHRWANLLDTKVVIPEVLQVWRIHEKNTSSDSERSSAVGLSAIGLFRKYKNLDLSSMYLRKANEYREMRILLSERKGTLSVLTHERNIEKADKEINEVIDAHVNRAKLFRSGWFEKNKIIVSMIVSGQYKHFQGFRSVLKDVMR
jgi:glycosyltransferase involved in cell wall biosynthesis